MDTKKTLREKELEQCFNDLKGMYGSEIPTILNDIREAVEQGLTNTMLMDEVLGMKVETEEGKKILNKLEGEGTRTLYATEISSVFYHLRMLNDLLVEVNRYINY